MSGMYSDYQKRNILHLNFMALDCFSHVLIIVMITFMRDLELI